MHVPRPALDWLAEAVLYQIYPQSFADSDGDGIGDFAGIEQRLDHLEWLGVNTVWLNPCFTSPFLDAGYDIADYYTVAPRYGTNDDLARLVDAAGRRGIRVLLDLVAGHTSDRHPWFRASADDPSDERYIWAATEAPPHEGFEPSPGARPGWYLPNFFPSQPALNFGYAHTDPDEPWRLPVDAEGPRANRRALRGIMAHWLNLGVSGFRVDMAASLVKDDPGHVETGRLWRELRSWIDRAHPQAALLSEWGDPAVSVPAGFHADFFLQFGSEDNGRTLRSLLSNRTGTVDEAWPPMEPYFAADGRGTPRIFLDGWQRATKAIDTAGRGGHICLPTANHDFSRPACGPRTAAELPALFAFQLTWPTLPAVYYGDEIGMRYVPGLTDHEGSRLGPSYDRAGSRTPMQWDDDRANAGFSTAPATDLYLPLDPDPARPTVAAQRTDPGSLLHLVRRLIALRKASPELGSGGSVEVLHAGYPLVYVRGERYVVVVNPRREPTEFALPERLSGAAPVEVSGVEVRATRVHAEGFGYGVLDLHAPSGAGTPRPRTTVTP
ncbi:alpha-amylase family glycosyl hydrolase [Streptomyces luteolus]|uniref:Alpha-amylase family glycosyl hydrolase n=1 Tax=Streptomyces luteolus TaxID=3043615 RepID=A0ABT6SZS3_9ACTN|nr:alpha-amylase family glycosyl hydrolase [Streptomyces sp. B-S-A12]MDI3421112.1 alpha-amylase family glycosyl hydrolase [Streptomyces sp. B-S-A12]